MVGLFGTCGDSRYRQNLFIPEYTRLEIPFFNPQVDDWNPEFAAIESDHLTHDVVQCWPVLGSTYGTGSLAEQGFSIASSLRAATPLPKFVIPMIETDLDESLTEEAACKESLRSRALVAEHLGNNASPNVFVVSSLEEMLETSIILYGVAKGLVELSKEKNPAYQRFIEGRDKILAFDEAMRSGKLGSVAQTLASRNKT